MVADKNSNRNAPEVGSIEGIHKLNNIKDGINYESDIK